MSQTLSLQPGKYALFISPPIAGVDYTGTPLPTVSYQWKKNGVAIAGQTNATISGVWVEQTGGTVDLVDGDVISIDIILTNPVSVATKTISATIDSAIPAPVISPVSIRQLSGGSYQTVTSLANTDIGEQVIVASNTGGTVTTTPPVPTTYQWRRGFAPIAGATSQTYTLQAADADSIIDCVVTATNAGGTSTATATVVVGTVGDAGGWTELTPSADSRLIYISNEGDDTAAASVKGRGYYLPSDPEIGPDPTNPVGPIVAYRTIAAAKQKILEDAPTWVMLRRGDTFEIAEYPALPLRGRSGQERAVLTAWGPESAAMPRIVPASSWNLDSTPWFDMANPHKVFAHVDFDIRLRWLTGSSGILSNNILLEGCRFGYGLASLNGAWVSTITIRRCVVVDAWLSDADYQGIFIANYYALNGVDPSGTVQIEAVIEDCVFDLNAYKDDPDDATTWRGGMVGAILPAGTGLGPRRVVRDRNMYCNYYGSLRLQGNIISRGAGGGSVQMREGGVAERNLFMWNPESLGTGHPQMFPDRHKGALVKDNVILHDDHILPPGGWGAGIGAGGADDDLAVLDGNILAHFHRMNGGDPKTEFGLAGKRYHSEAQPASKLMRGIIKDNVIYRQFGGDGIDVFSTERNDGVLSAAVTGNCVSSTGTLSTNGNAALPAGSSYAGNKFHTPEPYNQFKWGTTAGTFSQWQSAGFDTDGTFTNDFAAFKAAAGWTAPERDIVSYMQSVDPTYVVNEDVYLDEGASVKQVAPRKVWEVLVDRSLFPADDWFDNKVLDEVRAKQAARRYHAFITFIQRARSNRKGAWDTRWTAEAVNNYIRAGFGKPAVSGAYDGRSLADRLLDYTT